MATEQELQQALLTSYAVKLPHVRLFRRNVFFGETASGARMRAGIRGQADIYGYVRGAIARPFELELKALRGRLSPEQERWQSFCAAWGIPHLVLRPEKFESTEETIDRWCKDISQL